MNYLRKIILKSIVVSSIIAGLTAIFAYAVLAADIPPKLRPVAPASAGVSIQQEGPQMTMPIYIDDQGVRAGDIPVTAVSTPTGSSANISSYSWSLGTPTYSTDNVKFVTVTTGEPAFSIPSTATTPTVSVSATVTGQTTPGYWRVPVNLTAKTLAGTTLTALPLNITFVIGGDTPIPDYSISVSPGTVSMCQGQGSSTTVTVHSLNNCSGPVTLSYTFSHDTPAGMTAYFYDSTTRGNNGANAPHSAGSANITINLPAGKSYSLNLNICTCAAPPGMPPVNADTDGVQIPGASPYTMLIQGLGTTGVMNEWHTAPISVLIMPQVSTGNVPSPPGDIFPGGVGRRASTTIQFYKIAGTAVLPPVVPRVSPGQSGVVFDLCQEQNGSNMTKDNSLADMPDIYLGSSRPESDFGFGISHGGTVWGVMTNGCIRKTKVPANAPEGFTGTVDVAVELPGCPESNFAYQGYAYVAGGRVTESSEILVVKSSGQTYRYYARANGLNTAFVKRCNTISQSTNTSANPPGNKKAFVQTGTAVYGAAWSNVTVYGKFNTSGTSMINDTVPCTFYTFPKNLKPPLITVPSFVYFIHGSDYYANESNIDMALDPLVGVTSPCSYP